MWVVYRWHEVLYGQATSMGYEAAGISGAILVGFVDLPL